MISIGSRVADYSHRVGEVVGYVEGLYGVMVDGQIEHWYEDEFYVV